jgi:serine O-acetyltransferase
LLKTLIEDLDAYAYRLGLPKWSAFGMIFLYPATWAIVVYRFGNWVTKCKLPILKHVLFIFYFILKRLSEVLTGIENGLFIGHIGGVIIGNGSMIGNNPSFHEGVTIGGAGRGDKHGSPNIGNNVYFGAGAKVMGKIKVGNNVMIGANAVVVKDVPDNAVVGGCPLR